MKNNPSFVQFFRQASPYIHRHRGKCFVFFIEDETASGERLKALLHDIAILHSLGVKIVVVFGAMASLAPIFQTLPSHQEKPVIDSKSMRQIQAIVGAMSIRIQAILSMGLANSPMEGAGIETALGNFILAKPLGVRDGVDFGLMGEIRKVRHEAINRHLDSGDIVIIPPLGYSATGEVFGLDGKTLATQIAITLAADKLVCYTDAVLTMIDANQSHTTLSHEGKAITPHEAKQLAKTQSGQWQQALLLLADACQRGINRAHIIPQGVDGALFAELFTRDGFGLMITDDAYDRIEQATIHDIPGLLELIRPLEKEGILVRRSRELLEMEIEHFSLLKRDDSIIGCAALYPYLEDQMGELGCVAVSPEYRKNGLAERLLEHIEKKARNNGIKQLFCLTTHTSHWFMERGFSPVDLTDLPAKKQAFYNYERRSKAYVKRL